jgi:hypothetical protein
MAEIETALLSRLNALRGICVRKRLSGPEVAADTVKDALLKALRAADKRKDEENSPLFSSDTAAGIIMIFRRNAPSLNVHGCLDGTCK